MEPEFYDASESYVYVPIEKNDGVVPDDMVTALLTGETNGGYYSEDGYGNIKFHHGNKIYELGRKSDLLKNIDRLNK